MTSLIYGENLNLELNSEFLMEDKQCKQTERFSVMTKGRDYFSSLDDESKSK